MTAPITVRPARKSDASEIALLVNIATHGGMTTGWAANEKAKDTYDPVEVGRLDMMTDEAFGWRSVTMAEADDEVVGMLLGYRELDAPQPIKPDTPAFFKPLLELEVAAAGTWFISMLGVHVPWRSRGVGSALLNVAERKSTETRAHGLSLIVEDENEGAQRLYKSRGFAVRTARPMLTYSGAPQPGREWVLMVKE